MNCLLCKEKTVSLRRMQPCCPGCRNDFDEARKTYGGFMMDILTGKMSDSEFKDMQAIYEEPEEDTPEEDE